MTVGFGPRLDPRYGTRVPHDGVDIATVPGEPVRLVYPGRVVYAADFEGYGPTVVVQHAGRAFTLYAGGVIVGETLAPECEAGPPGCAPPGTRNETLGFPGVDGASTSITPVSPAGSSCVVRHDPGEEEWPLFPNTVTNVSIDCM